MIKTSMVLAMHWKVPLLWSELGARLARSTSFSSNAASYHSPNNQIRDLSWEVTGNLNYKRGHQLHLNTFFEIYLQGNKNRMATDSRLNTPTYPVIPFALSFWLQEKPGSWVAAPFPFPCHLPSRRATFNLIIYITLASAIRHCTNTRSEGSTCPKEPTGEQRQGKR